MKSRPDRCALFVRDVKAVAWRTRWRGAKASNMLSFANTGTYVENSALDAFLRDPRAFGDGPFVVSEFSLAEKSRLQWDRYRAFVLGAHALGVRFLRVPPVTQLITGKLDPRWFGEISLDEIDVALALSGRRVASLKLEEVCETLASQFSKRFSELRPHMQEWIERVESDDQTELLDPRGLSERQLLVEAFALDLLRRDAPPLPSDALPDRLAWTLRAWETAMTLVRLDRQRDLPRDLRNDPIDGLHYTLATVFCSAIATSDKGLKRIQELMPSPRVPLLWVQERPSGVVVTS